jgi:hypothetical protein
MLDEPFRSWLQRVAASNSSTVEEVAKWLGKAEIANRHEMYPKMRGALLRAPFDMDVFAKAARKAWGSGGRYDLTHFSDFARRPESTRVLTSLICDFPGDDLGAEDRIDAFIGQCLLLGYTHPNGRRRFAASAALLASTILTAIIPERFVDFRIARWADLAAELKYRLFVKSRPSYGEMIVSAGHFAEAIVATETFQKLWGDEKPLWIIAGICWDAHYRERH